LASHRLFLSPYDLTPTYKLVHNKFSVKYYLNLVLVDEEDRRYFKQQEIQLYRQTETGAAEGTKDITRVRQRTSDGTFLTPCCKVLSLLKSHNAPASALILLPRTGSAPCLEL